jgi:hypothetical protein
MNLHGSMLAAIVVGLILPLKLVLLPPSYDLATTPPPQPIAVLYVDDNANANVNEATTMMISKSIRTTRFAIGRCPIMTHGVKHHDLCVSHPQPPSQGRRTRRKRVRANFVDTINLMTNFGAPNHCSTRPACWMGLADQQ